VTHTTKVEFQSKGKGPFADMKPLTIYVQVEDHRPDAERQYLIQIVADIGGTDRWNTKRSAGLIVQDALVSELSKCGHRVVTAPGPGVDASVIVGLTRFKGFFALKGVFGGKVDTHINADITVRNEVRKTTIPPFQISGDYEKAIGSSFNASKARDALSAALADFIHNLTFDSRLVEGLQ
jgi:hypothetical protein